MRDKTVRLIWERIGVVFGFFGGEGGIQDKLPDLGEIFVNDRDVSDEQNIRLKI